MNDLMEEVTVSVKEIINSESAITPQEGELVFAKISEILSDQTKVVIDFTGVKTLISAFLNTAIGSLCHRYDPVFLNSHLEFAGIVEESDIALINYVIKNAQPVIVKGP